MPDLLRRGAMPNGLLPDHGPTDTNELTDPQGVVEAFLDALADLDMDRAMALVADDIVYTNVGLPSIRGRARVTKVLGGLVRPQAGFEVYLHSISADGPVVLTERTDVLIFGPFRAQFWVWGRFDVQDGRITLWRDSFDYLDLLRANVRGLLVIVVPSLRPQAPSVADAPGR